MVTLHQTEVDGVRCFWVETGRPTLAARLFFRQGIADEPLRESGWLHLLEHLALHGRESGTLQVNGSVSLLTTAFDAHGPADLVSAHLRGVTGWLAAPSFDELDRERNVLRAEAEMRGGPPSRALTWRYGARGPGVASYFEPALGAATPDQLGRRAAAVFTRGNAVLALDGPPPTDLRLDLPEGGLLPAPDAEPCEETPAAYVENEGLVVSGVVARSAAATMVPDLLQRALTDRLRHQDGSAYAPWATYEHVDETRAVILAGSDVAPGGRQNLVGTILALLARIARTGAQGSHLTDAIQARRQAMHDPYAAYGVAIQAAHSVLNGREAMTFDELVAELDWTSVDLVQHSLAEFHNSLLLGVPGDTAWENQLPMLSDVAGEPRLDGRRFRSVGWPAEKEELCVGPSGFEVRRGGEATTIELDQVEAVFAFQDGGRHVVRRDGYGIAVEPQLWRNGTDAIAAMDSALPAELRLPHPHRNPPLEFDTPGWLRRWGRFVLNGMLRPNVVLSTLIIAAVAVLCAIEVALVGLLVYVVENRDSALAERVPGGVLGLMISFVAVLIYAVVKGGAEAWNDEVGT